MLSIIHGSKVSELDKVYCQQEKISSWELMEKAAESFCAWFFAKYPNSDIQTKIFCGPGNNGGDGLAIARILSESGYGVSVVYFKELIACSKDFQVNFKKLPVKIQKIASDDFDFQSSDVLIDGIFGVGINRPVEGKYLEVIKYLNQAKGDKVAIDIPSGIPSDDLLEGEAFKADFSITFQFPKFSLLLPEHAEYTGEMIIADIGIDESLLRQFSEKRFYLEEDDIKKLHHSLHRFSHKGDYGKLACIGGSKGKVGAILLTAKAALRTGSGLVSLIIPESERMIPQIALTEAMVLTEIDAAGLENFDVLAVGPGWGTSADSFEQLKVILNKYKKPIVFDADALNLFAKNKEILQQIPSESILTPHLKEFDRLAGDSKNQLERFVKAKEFVQTYNVYLVLKGAFTSIFTPDGLHFFNPTGNQYMATGGSGDVLTGIIASLLGQGYTSKEAAICGVFHHGLAGELASRKFKRGTIASDIINKIPESFTKLNIT